MPESDELAPLSGTVARCLLVSIGLCVLWAGSAWTAGHVRTDASLHTVALFVHLVALVVGFGAVLAVDYTGALWLLGRCTLAQAVESTGPLHVPVWAGLAGLTASGILLEPQLDSPLTRVKLLLVLLIALNGVHATALTKRLEAAGPGRPERRLLVRGALSALVSQLGWWGALAIGFWNTQH
ncbi:hypothetical protein AB0442_26770 [Kitasatospora sp. NPDC085895]|uniref:hypothetical protein n=1 Tax=Kitasatospora sp. NPDC085895 TaxID=3155057 RepID=UPI00344DCCD1